MPPKTTRSKPVAAKPADDDLSDVKVLPREKATASPANFDAYMNGLSKMPTCLHQMGIPSLRPGQDEAVHTIMQGQDSIVILPTSTGKSLCFELPTLCMGWKTIILYPLIALIDDQFKQMSKKGLRVGHINSNLGPEHNNSVLMDWAAGKIDFMLVSPERFQNAAWYDIVKRHPPDFVAMDECFVGDVEILTESGFVRFDQLADGVRVMQVDPATYEMTLTMPEKVIRRQHVGEIVSIRSERGIDVSVTPNHELLVYREDGSWRKRTAAQAKFSHMWRMRAAAGSGVGRDALTPWERLQTAFQADGSHHSKSSVTFAFTKQRKIDRFLRLMADGGFIYRELADSREHRRRFLVSGVTGLSKRMRDVVDYNELSSAACRALVDECIAWDGSEISDRLGYYSSTVEDNTDFFQEVCIRAGLRARKTKQIDDRSEAFSDVHRLFIRLGDPYIDTQNFQKETQSYDGMVYCVSVPTGCIVVRRAGKPVVIGNCHTFAKWADTFRHGYKVAGILIQELRPKVVAAFSATLSSEDEEELRGGMGLEYAKRVFHYPRRTNLHPHTIEFDRVSDVFPWIAQSCNGATVVYLSTTKGVDECAAVMANYTTRPVIRYHGKMKKDERRDALEAFMRPGAPIVFATNAFGMGVNKKDVRHVVHIDPPANAVDLIQEMGRAGRDGEDSHCWILDHADGARKRKNLVDCSHPALSDIEQFVRASMAMQDHNGVITSLRKDMCEAAGVSERMAGPIMEFCQGEGIYVPAPEVAKQIRIRFAEVITSMNDLERKTRDAVLQLGIDRDRDTWLHVDVESLATFLNIKVPATLSRLYKMAEAGKLTMVKPDSRAPLRVCRTWDDVPQSSKDRIHAKHQAAEEEFRKVLQYIKIDDEDKHEFLEASLPKE